MNLLHDRFGSGNPEKVIFETLTSILSLTPAPKTFAGSSKSSIYAESAWPQSCRRQPAPNV